MDRSTVTGRGLLTLGGAAMAGIGLPSLVTACDIDSGGANNSTQRSAGRQLASEAPLPEPFRTPLPIPPVLQPVRSDRNADDYEIVQRAGQAAILPGLTTEIWGYDGIFPGPTLVSRRGRRTVVTHRNALAVPVSVHLHGGRNAPEQDGYPTDLILPRNGSFGHGSHRGRTTVGARDYSYDIAQAERFDVVVDFSGHDVGDEITMVNEHGDDRTADEMRFVVTPGSGNHRTVDHPREEGRAPVPRPSRTVPGRRARRRRRSG
jgi:FtsP/CotA-like multicopper oxidase with cupredoxin domain